MDAAKAEQRALIVGMLGNLFMGAAGVTAALLSNSQALLVDGLFSLIGFTAALIARRVTATAQAAPDRDRPFGYAYDETIFATFRSLSLLGLVAFASAGAVQKIVGYLNGAPVVELRYEVIAIYMVVVCGTGAGLWAYHRWTWQRTGRRSDILKLEARAAMFDTLISVAAGAGIAAVYFLQDGPLAPIAPIGDSLVVLGLCAISSVAYYEDLRVGIAELAGVTARPAVIARAGRAIRPVLVQADVRLVDLGVQKTGRSYVAAVYIAPSAPMRAPEVDALSARLSRALGDTGDRFNVYVVLSEIGRGVSVPQAGE